MNETGQISTNAFRKKWSDEKQATITTNKKASMQQYMT